MEEKIYENARIVIVDDVEEVLHSTKNCLEFEGMQVKCFLNPLEGLEYLKNNKDDVLLLDFFMPEMNGDKFVEELRKYNKETIIILQTGYSDKIPPLEMIDKMNIQGYLDKLKGEDELVLMTKAAVKTSFLNKKIREKDKEIAKLNYKKAITGNLITNLVNESKDQLMQISGMNESIRMDTDTYTAENDGIKDALGKIYELYEALNFENMQEVNLIRLNNIIQKLLKPTLLLSNAEINFDNSNENTIINNNVSDIVYFIIKCVEILLSKGAKRIDIKNDNNYLDIISQEQVENIKLDELEVFIDENVLKIELNENAIRIFI